MQYDLARDEEAVLDHGPSLGAAPVSGGSGGGGGGPNTLRRRTHSVGNLESVCQHLNGRWRSVQDLQGLFLNVPKFCKRDLGIQPRYHSERLWRQTAHN